MIHRHTLLAESLWLPLLEDPSLGPASRQHTRLLLQHRLRPHPPGAPEHALHSPSLPPRRRLLLPERSPPRLPRRLPRHSPPPPSPIGPVRLRLRPGTSLPRLHRHVLLLLLPLPVATASSSSAAPGSPSPTARCATLPTLSFSSSTRPCRRPSLLTSSCSRATRSTLPRSGRSTCATR